jgi:hypothetical protein
VNVKSIEEALLYYSKTFSVKGDLNKAFDLTEKYVQGMKFKIKNEVKPTLLVLERGSRWGSIGSTKIESTKTTLTISLKQVAEDIAVLCDYEIEVYGIVLQSDMSSLDSEVEKLHNFLTTALAP